MNAAGDALNAQVARALAESEHLRIDPSQLTYLPEYDIMTGGFGTVRVATLEDQMVAVKELRIAGNRKDRARFSLRFARELKVWAPLDHPNLLKLSGFYTDADMSIAQFICPFYTHGHIRSYIDANQPDQTTRLKLAEDTALGLRYLHDLRIAHGDLKELNVLVDLEPRALLCDYGLSKMLNPDGEASGLTTTGLSLSVRFASPEILNGSRPDLPSDIWAWACLFLKIVTDVGPYEGTLEMACMMKIIQGTPPANVSALSISSTLGNMLERCWNLELSARPSIQQCIDVVESAKPKEKPVSPPLPFDAPLMPSSYIWDDSSAVPSMKSSTLDLGLLDPMPRILRPAVIRTDQRLGGSTKALPVPPIVDMCIGKWLPGPNYAPVLDYLSYNIVKPPHLDIHPLLRPISESRDSSDPFLVFDVLFPGHTIHVSNEPARKSWSKGRTDPATFPRLKIVRLINKFTPWAIQVMSDSPWGITVADIANSIHDHFRVYASEDNDWNNVQPATQSEILMAYKWNRSTEIGAPGDIMPNALLRGDFLMERTMFAGLKLADPELLGERLGVKNFPATFELLLHTR